jgi:hypothetical protein
MEFDANFVRLGGKLRISSCVVRPYSFVIAEISGINMMLHLRKRRSLEMNLHEEKKSFSDSVTQEILGKDSVMRSFVITKDECVQTKKRTQRSQEIRVGEELIESPYSFLVPIAFLKFLLIDRADEYEVESPLLLQLTLLLLLLPPLVASSLQVLRNRFSLPDVDPNYSGDDWKQSIAAVVKRDLENIQQSITAYENTSLTFKSSSKKSDHSLRYIPINLHLHIFKMTGEVSSKRKQQDSLSSSPSPSSQPSSSIAKYTCDFMTVGAFAAHSMKYKSGGLWHMMKMFDEKLSKQTKGLIPVLKDDFRLPDEVSLSPNPLAALLTSLQFSFVVRFGTACQSHSCHWIAKYFTWLTVLDKDLMFVSHSVLLLWSELLPYLHSFSSVSISYCRSLGSSLVSVSCLPRQWSGWLSLDCSSSLKVSCPLKGARWECLQTCPSLPSSSSSHDSPQVLHH